MMISQRSPCCGLGFPNRSTPTIFESSNDDKNNLYLPRDENRTVWEFWCSGILLMMWRHRKQKRSYERDTPPARAKESNLSNEKPRPPRRHLRQCVPNCHNQTREFVTRTTDRTNDRTTEIINLSNHHEILSSARHPSTIQRREQSRTNNGP